MSDGFCRRTGLLYTFGAATALLPSASNSQAQSLPLVQAVPRRCQIWRLSGLAGAASDVDVRAALTTAENLLAKHISQLPADDGTRTASVEQLVILRQLKANVAAE